jgi:chlorobactene glucosyltransferase
MSVASPLLWSLPWVIGPAAAIARSLNSRSLSEYPADVAAPTPLLSVIVPARNERRNIERCVRSILSTSYPDIEVIVVDDHSTDGTGDAARAIADGDRRVSVIESPPLPGGWFGKQWACASGAAVAHGDLLLFADADTRHSPDLLPRAVNAMRELNADLFTVAGHQEMHSFWERIVQPQIFGLIALRYGGTEHVSNATRAVDVIANGQFMLMRRDVYAAMGGHDRVRGSAAEDLSMAQEYFRAGRRVTLMLGIDQLSTHMYASLAEVVAGWRKNVYAAGRDSAPGGRVGRALYPALLIGIPLVGLSPPAAFLAAALGVLSAPWLLWSGIAVAAALVYWGVIYFVMREPVAYASLYPLGLLVFLYIAIGAIVRGERVAWKGREYRLE